MALRDVKYVALLIESERGWGSKIDERKQFDTEAERDAFIEKFNTQNTQDSAPDWYMYATVGETVIL